MSALLHIRKLRKTVGQRLLLDIDELVIPAASCLVLSGRNGVGKTTLLTILAGLEEPDSAEVVYQDQALPWKVAKHRFVHETVYLHQQPYMFDRSVADNVAYGLRHSGLGKQEIRRRVEAGLAWAGLTHLAGRNARELSGGEKQRVALTRARILSPCLLLLDEPTANMDIESREQTVQLIQRLKREGVSSIVTTHEPQVANSIGDAHLHLCKSGPCRYTIVRPFLYQQDNGTEQALMRQLAPSAWPAPEPASQAQRPMTQAFADASIPVRDITAVILAGGRARRMGGEDKGLLRLNNRAMIEYVIDTLRSQAGTLLINANRNEQAYGHYGYPLVKDMLGDYFGPLVGIASAMQAADTPLLLSVPCDSPLLPDNLIEKLYSAMHREHAEISVAHDGERMQPVFALLKCELLPSLLAYLQAGGRKIDTWYKQHRLALADFSGQPETFLNVNTPEQRASLEASLKQQRPQTTPSP